MSDRTKKNRKYRNRKRLNVLREKWGDLPKAVLIDLERQEQELDQKEK